MKFKQFILEKFDLNSNVLYHATNFLGAIQILDHDALKSGSYSDPNGLMVKGISTTTDKNFFIYRKEVRFILDAKKIATDYKLIGRDEKIPNSKNNTIYDESEILIKTDTLTNLHKYLKSIELYKTKTTVFEAIQKKAYDYQNKFGIVINII